MLNKTCTKCDKNFPLTKEFFQPTNRKSCFESWCKQCKSLTNARRLFRIKLEVLQAYCNGAPCCACCGEKLLEFLSIGHINGGGSAHRRELRGKSTTIYTWLKAQNMPEGFRVLCINCNTSLGFHGYCPHSTQPQA